MSRKGESIFKRKDGRWEGRYIKKRTPQGKAVYGYVYGRTYGKVKEKMHQMVVESEIAPQLTIESISVYMTFSALAGNWLYTRRINVKESTYIKYRNMLDHYILPYLGKFAVMQITVDTLNSFYCWLLTEGGKKKQGLSSKTASDVFSVIRSVLRYARVQKIPTSCAGTEIVMRSKHRELCILSASEQDQLVKYLVSHPSRRSLGILVCLYTGIRLGEVCALRWEDISEREKTIYVHRTMQRLQLAENEKKKTAVVVTAPKSPCSIRTIPIPPALQGILDEYRTVSGYLLTGEENYVEPRTMENHFKRMLKASGLSNINFHCLRHTFATRCVEVGFDIKTLSEILGHANITITMERYVHPTMQMKRENMNRLSSLFLVN